MLGWLARSDFQIRYKRAVFGIAWSVLVPLLQAAVLILVFSKFARFADFDGYPVFVLSGVACWSYFSGTIGTGSTAIVDQSTLTDKVWFPRALLPLVPALSGLVGFLVSIAAVIVVAAVQHGLSAQLAILPLAIALLVVFTAALSLVLAALHVYFRDVRFLVQAALLVWFWATPIAYPQSFVEGLAPWLSLNPVTGIVTLFRMSFIGADHAWGTAVLVSVVTTLALLVVTVEVHRRHDRLFVDLL